MYLRRLLSRLCQISLPGDWRPPPRALAPAGRSWDDDPLNLTGKWGKDGDIVWIGGRYDGDYIWIPRGDTR